jgi:hypothetical protein
MYRAEVARVAHEVNRAYCESLGDTSQPSWEDAPEWQKQSAMDGVNFHIERPDASPAESHAQWLAVKEADGWVWGEVKNPALREHPCMLPYEELPVEYKAKDYIFRGVVNALRSHLNGA